MLRLASHQQALKVLCTHPHSPLCKSLKTCHIHTKQAQQAPYNGPPSYATIARRFSSPPNPLTYFAKKEEQEAIKRGEWVDIYDVGPKDPEEFDVLITDIDDHKLRTKISDCVGIEYLRKVTGDQANKVITTGQAFIYGWTDRLIFPCVVSVGDDARWVFFIVDTGAPFTYLSNQAAQAFGMTRDRRQAKIAGYSNEVHTPSKTAHFSEVNILGYDFIAEHGVALLPPDDDKSVKLLFNFYNRWKLVPSL